MSVETQKPITSFTSFFSENMKDLFTFGQYSNEKYLKTIEKQNAELIENFKQNIQLKPSDIKQNNGSKTHTIYYY